MPEETFGIYNSLKAIIFIILFSENPKRPQIIAIIGRVLEPSEISYLLARQVSLLELRLDYFYLSYIKYRDADAFSEHRLSFERQLSIQEDFLSKSTCPSFQVSEPKTHMEPVWRELLERLVIEIFRLHSYGFRLLATLRVADAEISSASRLTILQAITPYVDIIDVEYESPSDERSLLRSSARLHNTGFLLSSHDFSKTPKTESMYEILKEAHRLEASMLKLAFYAHTKEDLVRLSSFALRCAHPCLIWMSMGDWGTVSRIASVFWGSRCVYAYLDKPNVAGQLSLELVHRSLFRYHPIYRSSFAKCATLNLHM